jgi:hypothetical protein
MYLATPYDLFIYVRNMRGSFDFDGSKWTVIHANNYLHSEEEGLVDDNEMIHFQENRDIAIWFKADDQVQTRLYIEALDYYNNDLCEEDEQGNVYIPPTGTIKYLFKNDNRNTGVYYPFIPGRYRFYVQHGTVKDYFYLRVDPKSMNWAMLDEMRQEVEEQVETMARNLIENKAIIEGKDDHGDRGLLSAQILQLSKYADKICLLTQQRKYAPRYAVNKRYQLVGPEKAAAMDHETIKYHLKHPEQRQSWLVPGRELSYLLPENLMIIRCVKYLHSISKKALNFIHTYLAHTSAELEKKAGELKRYPNRIDRDKDRLAEQKRNLERQRHAIRRMIYSSVLFLDETWVKQVAGNRNSSNRSLGLQTDSRYRRLYEIYKQIKQEKVQMTLSIDYTYCWKRTDKVYELWGFIRMLKAMQSDQLGFKPIDGWIFSQSDENRHSNVIPILQEGTAVTLEKREDPSSVIRLVYDEALPVHSTDTDFEHPLFTTNRHRRPDARLDCYKDGEYKASFIMDFKYRPPYAIKAAYSGNPQDKVFEQLNDYKHFESRYVDKNKDYRVPTDRYEWKRDYPIAQVWVMYPNMQNELITEGEVGFVKIPYGPMDSVDKLASMVRDAFEKCRIFDR